MNHITNCLITALQSNNAWQYHMRSPRKSGQIYWGVRMCEWFDTAASEGDASLIPQRTLVVLGLHIDLFGGKSGELIICIAIYNRNNQSIDILHFRFIFSLAWHGVARSCCDTFCSICSWWWPGSRVWVGSLTINTTGLMFWLGPRWASFVRSWLPTSYPTCFNRNENHLRFCPWAVETNGASLSTSRSWNCVHACEWLSEWMQMWCMLIMFWELSMTCRCRPGQVPSRREIDVALQNA